MPDTQVIKSQSRHAKPLLVSFFEWFGELGIFCGRLVHGAFAPPYEVREFIHQLDAVGSLSLPLVAIAGAATGVVLSLEARDSLVRFGAKGLLPALIQVPGSDARCGLHLDASLADLGGEFLRHHQRLDRHHPS